MQIREIVTLSELKEIYPVLRELRSTPTFEHVAEVTELARRQDGFKLVAAYVDDRCLAVMGYRILYDYTHGKNLYVDDLVVTSSARRTGVGRKLIEFAEAEAKRLGCQALRLCTGVDNMMAQQFYRSCGWSPKSYAFKKFLANT
jgi:GNAT superfamily N-acetyltransferase